MPAIKAVAVAVFPSTLTVIFTFPKPMVGGKSLPIVDGTVTVSPGSSDSIVPVLCPKRTKPRPVLVMLISQFMFSMVVSPVFSTTAFTPTPPFMVIETSLVEVCAAAGISSMLAINIIPIHVVFFMDSQKNELTVNLKIYLEKY